MFLFFFHIKWERWTLFSSKFLFDFLSFFLFLPHLSPPPKNRAFDSQQTSKLLKNPVDYIVSFEAALKEHIDFSSQGGDWGGEEGDEEGMDADGLEKRRPGEGVRTRTRYFVGFEGLDFFFFLIYPPFSQHPHTTLFLSLPSPLFSPLSSFLSPLR